MPHGSRARKTRRNRNKRTKQPPLGEATRSGGILHQTDANKHENEEKKEDEGSILAGNNSMDCPGEDFLIESNFQIEREGDQMKVNGHAVKVSEVGSPSSTVIRSIESPNNPGVGHQQLRRVPVSLRHRLERRTLGSQVKIYEITTVSGPLAASVGHIAGVGDVIVETDVGGQKAPGKLGPVVTISEPAEPSALMFLRTTSQSKDGLEIQEIEGEGEGDEGLSLKQQHGRVVVVEPDSDFETRGAMASVIVEESSDIVEERDSEICDENSCKDEIEVEEREIIIPDCDGNGESMDQVERDNREKILGQGGMRPTRKDEGYGGFSSKETIECKESADRMKCSMEAKCQESDGLNNDFKLEGSTKGIDQPGTGVPTQELQNKLGVFSKGPELSYIPSDHGNLLDNSISLFDNRKLCQPVTSSGQINSVNSNNSNNSNSRQEKMKKRLILESYFSEARHADRFLDIIQEEADKLSEDEEQHIRDFINEEIGKFRHERRYIRDDSENRGSDEDQDGREEMESEREEDNNWDFKDDKFESGGIQDLKVSPDTQANIAFNEKPAEEMIISSCEKKEEGARKNKLILNNERSYSLKNSLRHCVENNKGNKVEDLTSTSRQVVIPLLPPVPPKRSSSFISRDIESAMVLLNPPQVDYPLPVSSFESSAQTDKFYSGAEDTCDKPARPPLPLALFPTSNSSDSGWPLPISASIERNRGGKADRGERRERGHGGMSSKENTSTVLRNEACDAVEIGNDANKIEASRSCPEIAYDHTGSELSATMSALQTEISGSSSDLAGTRSDGISACESQRVLSASSPVECYCAVRAFVGDRAEYRGSGSGTGEEEEEEVESSRPFGYKVSCEKNKNVVEVAEPKKENKRKVEEVLLLLLPPPPPLDEKNQLETVKLEGEKRVVDSGFKVKSQIEDEDHNDRDCELKNLAGSQSEGQGANKTEESQVNTASVGDKIAEWGREKRREKETNDDPLRYQVDGENNQSTLYESREAATGICFADTPATEFLYESSSNVECAPPDTCHAEFISGSSASENTSECAAKDLFYVPRENTYDFSILKGKHRDCPSSLTELSIRKILSMPYGLKIINEITHPQFNISVEKEEGQSFENPKSSGLEEVDSAVKVVEMIKRRPKSWMGVPTSENPQLLVCLSPSQQNLNTDKSRKGSNKSLEIRIPDADKLLDLHKKFINRRSYHDSSGDNRRGGESFAIPKYYRVEVNSRKESTAKDLGLPENNKLKSELEQSNQSNRVTGSSSNRLLKIIKENPIDNQQCLLLRAAQEPVSVPGNSHKNNNVRQDRSKSTRLSEWLTLARNDPTDFAKYQKIYCHSDSQRDHCQDNLPSAFSPVNRKDTTNKTRHLNTNTNINNNSESINDDNNNNNYLDGKNVEGSCNPRVNNALIIRSPDSSNEIINTGTLNKSPITYKSAIIDKSWSVKDHWNRTPVLYRGIDPGQVNPALINNDKPETPARPNRVQNLVVDRSCIDTTSIFDKTPPRRYLEPRRYHHPEVEALNHRQAITGTNAGIIEKKVPEDDKENNRRETLQVNLKRFRAAKDIKELTDARRRHSLPSELFDRQLEYINRLEDHSEEVKIGENGNGNAKTEIADDQDKSYYGEDNGRQSWRSQSKVYEKDRGEILTSEGHLEQTKSCQVTEDGCRVEKSIRTFENTEERKSFSLWTLKNENREKQAEVPDAVKCMRSFDGEEKGRNDKTEKDKDKRAPDTYQGKSEIFDGNKMIKPTGKSISIFPTTDETLREKMYDEYRDKVLEREERKYLKVIKISSHVDFPGSQPGKPPDKSNASDSLNSIQREFIEKARNRMTKFEINLDDSETEISKEDTSPPKTAESTSGLSSSYTITSCRTEETTGQIITSEVKEKNICECRRNEKPKCLIDGKEIKDVRKLPKHLQEFLVLADTDTPPPHHHNHDHHPDGVWSPGSSSDPYNRDRDPRSPDRGKNLERDAGIPPVWTPSSAGTSPVAERKEFRPVSFESPILGRRKKPQTEQVPQPQPPWKNESHPQSEDHPPAQEKKKDPSSNGTDGSYNISPRIVNSHSVPSQGLNTLATTPRLPRAQNPTITLLQKAREGQLPKGAAYLNESICLKNNDTGDLLDSVKKEDNENMKKTPRKIEGIGPITKNGMPVALRSEVKEDNQAKWYKQMYDSLHRAGKDDDYVTIQYKPRRGLRYGHGSSSGYLSEPEPRAYADKSATLDIRRRQRNKENDSSISTMPRKSALIKTTAEVYRNQPGRIENYQPSQSTPAVGVGEKETKEPFDQHNPHTAKPYMSHALKESGYESDSTLIFRRRDDVSPLSPLEQRVAYKTVQKGGDVPLHGLRKLAPERPKESPRRYVEGEVTIHYRSPVRTEAKEILSEEELARRSAENMRRVYQEERRRKYLQELHDIDSRRHTDNFIPSQKSPIPLNRYDDFLDDLSYRSRSQEQTPEPRLVARAMYNFVGQTSRELSFRRGDIILIRRQIDKNWYEGEHNAMVGLFPLNYVEVLPFEGMRSTPKKPYEGQARARFNFIAQTNLELSLVKGELVVLTRRVDDNWFEGRIGNRKGIFPVTYVEVIMEPGQHRPETPVSSKPVASPAAHSMLSNGTASGKLSMGPHHYTPSIPVKTSTTEPQYISLPRIGVTERNKLHVAPVNETLHIDTHSDTLPYRALYNYRPQNEDELELKENDTVFVIEKCDDGWFVGSSQRTGYFGTFPGNYVERL